MYNLLSCAHSPKPSGASPSTSRVAPHSLPLSPLFTYATHSPGSSTVLRVVRTIARCTPLWLKARRITRRLTEPKPVLKRGEALVRVAEHAQRGMNDVASTYDVLRFSVT
jgi:hypothetical protein